MNRPYEHGTGLTVILILGLLFLSFALFAEMLRS